MYESAAEDSFNKDQKETKSNCLMLSSPDTRQIWIFGLEHGLSIPSIYLIITKLLTHPGKFIFYDQNNCYTKMRNGIKFE